MKWRKLELLEPEQGPKMPPEMMARLMAEHRREIDTASDWIYETHKMRLEIGPLSWPER